MPVSGLVTFFRNLTLDENDSKIAGRLMREINNRISYLEEVGLGYLSLDRLSSSLSGGESQRIIHDAILYLVLILVKHFEKIVDRREFAVSRSDS